MASIHFRLEDEWVPLKEARATKTVKLSSLPLTDKMELRINNHHCQQQQSSLQKPRQEQQQRNRRKARIPEQRSDALS